MKTTIASCAGVLFWASIGVPDAAQAALNISSGPTKNMDCSAHQCRPTAKDAVLNVTDLAAMLSASSIKVATAGAAKDIRLIAPLSWTSGKRLTLYADRSVDIESPV